MVYQELICMFYYVCVCVIVFNLLTLIFIRNHIIYIRVFLYNIQTSLQPTNIIRGDIT